MKQKSQIIRIAVVDRSPIVRTGLRKTVSASPDLDLILEAADMEECLAALSESPVDILVAGVREPAKVGVEQVCQFKARCPEVTVLLYLTETRKVCYMDALQAGVQGFLLTCFDSREIVDTIRVAAHRRVAQLPMEALERLLATPAAEGTDSRSSYLALRPRELELLREMSSGDSYKEIGRRLNLAHSTVKKYAHQIITKLRANNRATAVLRAHQLSLLGP